MTNWFNDFKLKYLKAKRDAYSVVVQKYRIKWDKIDAEIKQIENAE